MRMQTYSGQYWLTLLSRQDTIVSDVLVPLAKELMFLRARDLWLCLMLEVNVQDLIGAGPQQRRQGGSNATSSVTLQIEGSTRGKSAQGGSPAQ